ncbi:MAG: hypothetical protein COT74_06265 [Bdellovibrionales bacterium CG10_big_fil_rev_8_21_14_0_10_45_34]|nr:MAG: hypothetical protein COT74_06265 [Bdellovibrionales bacterium CG10_big_fil_rev_8_21_14_0_10_45_34]
MKKVFLGLVSAGFALSLANAYGNSAVAPKSGKTTVETAKGASAVETMLAQGVSSRLARIMEVSQSAGGKGASSAVGNLVSAARAHLGASVRTSEKDVADYINAIFDAPTADRDLAKLKTASQKQQFKSLLEVYLAALIAKGNPSIANHLDFIVLQALDTKKVTFKVNGKTIQLSNGYAIARMWKAGLEAIRNMPKLNPQDALQAGVISFRQTHLGENSQQADAGWAKLIECLNSAKAELANAA